MIVVSDTDPFDPRLWTEREVACHIYLTDDLELYALVDEADYPFLVLWNWSSLGKKWKHGGRLDYARRSQSEFFAPDGEPYESPITGKIVRNRKRIQRTVFLHHVVAQRAGLIQPTPKHVLDHRNGNSLDCRRRNLRWVTKGFNTMNKHGLLEHVEVPAYVEVEGGYVPT